MHVHFLESNTLVRKIKSGCDKALKSKKTKFLSEDKTKYKKEQNNIATALATT